MHTNVYVYKFGYSLIHNIQFTHRQKKIHFCFKKVYAKDRKNIYMYLLCECIYKCMFMCVPILAKENSEQNVGSYKCRALG